MNHLVVGSAVVACTVAGTILVFQPQWTPDFLRKKSEFAQIPFDSSVESLEAQGFKCRTTSDGPKSGSAKYKVCSTDIRWRDEFGITIYSREVSFLGQDMIGIMAKGRLEENDAKLFDLHAELSKRYSRGTLPELWQLPRTPPVYKYVGEYFLVADRSGMKFEFGVFTPISRTFSP